MKQNLKYYRKKAKMTQEQLATKIRVSTQTIKNIESGKHSPKLSLALEIKKIFPKLDLKDMS